MEPHAIKFVIVSTAALFVLGGMITLCMYMCRSLDRCAEDDAHPKRQAFARLLRDKRPVPEDEEQRERRRKREQQKRNEEELVKEFEYAQRIQMSIRSSATCEPAGDGGVTTGSHPAELELEVEKPQRYVKLVTASSKTDTSISIIAKPETTAIRRHAEPAEKNYGVKYDKNDNEYICMPHASDTEKLTENTASKHNQYNKSSRKNRWKTSEYQSDREELCLDCQQLDSDASSGSEHRNSKKPSANHHRGGGEDEYRDYGHVHRPQRRAPDSVYVTVHREQHGARNMHHLNSTATRSDMHHLKSTAARSGTDVAYQERHKSYTNPVMTSSLSNSPV